MPAASAFLKGFGIKKGMIIEGYELVDVKIKHQQVERYRRYRYPTTMTFESDHMKFPKDVLNELRNLVEGSRTIKSQYGNPYLCVFGSLKFELKDNGRRIIIRSEGSAVRV